MAKAEGQSGVEEHDILVEPSARVSATVGFGREASMHDSLAAVLVIKTLSVIM